MKVGTRLLGMRRNNTDGLKGRSMVMKMLKCLMLREIAADLITGSAVNPMDNDKRLKKWPEHDEYLDR